MAAQAATPHPAAENKEASGTEIRSIEQARLGFVTVQDLQHVLEAEFFDSAAGAKISSKARLYGVKRLQIQRKAVIHANVTLRGDLVETKTAESCAIKIESYASVGRGTVVRPPHVTKKGRLQFCRQTIRRHVSIGQNCVIEAASIGDCAIVGNNCVIGKRCVLHDYCVIEEGAVVPADTVVPPFGVYRGVPARLVGFAKPSATTERAAAAVRRFDSLFKSNNSS